MKYLLLFLPLLVWAQPINSRVIGATATSLHVGYTAPTAGACTFAATTATPGFVNDLSTALRAGANSDAFIVYGSQPRAFKGAGQAGDREAIIGFRSTIHVVGRTYSLALQADISHTIVVTCPGGSQTVVRHTAKIAGIAPQSPQYLPGAHGNFGAPDFDWTDRTKPVIGTHSRTQGMSVRHTRARPCAHQVGERPSLRASNF